MRDEAPLGVLEEDAATVVGVLALGVRDLSQHARGDQLLEALTPAHEDVILGEHVLEAGALHGGDDLPGLIGAVDAGGLADDVDTGVEGRQSLGEVRRPGADAGDDIEGGATEELLEVREGLYASERLERSNAALAETEDP